MDYKGIIKAEANVLGKIAFVLENTGAVVYSKLGLKRDEVFFSDSVVFENGYFVEVRVIVGDENDKGYIEAVLYDNEGGEAVDGDGFDALALYIPVDNGIHLEDEVNGDEYDIDFVSVGVASTKVTVGDLKLAIMEVSGAEYTALSCILDSFVIGRDDNEEIELVDKSKYLATTCWVEDDIRNSIVDMISNRFDEAVSVDEEKINEILPKVISSLEKRYTFTKLEDCSASWETINDDVDVALDKLGISFDEFICKEKSMADLFK